MDALSAEVGRKMDALSAEMDALFAEVGRAEAQWYSSSPEQNKRQASPPPAVAVSPASPPQLRPSCRLPRKRRRTPNRPVAAVERESDAMAAMGRAQERPPGTRPLLSKTNPRRRRRRLSPFRPLRRPQLRPSCRLPRKRRRTPIAPSRRLSAKGATPQPRKWTGSKVIGIRSPLSRPPPRRRRRRPSPLCPLRRPQLRPSCRPPRKRAGSKVTRTSTSPEQATHPGVAAARPCAAICPLRRPQLRPSCHPPRKRAGSKVTRTRPLLSRPPPRRRRRRPSPLCPHPPPATSPILPPTSEAAVERKMEAMAAEVGRRAGRQGLDATPEQNKRPDARRGTPTVWPTRSPRARRSRVRPTCRGERPRDVRTAPSAAVCALTRRPRCRVGPACRSHRARRALLVPNEPAAADRRRPAPSSDAQAAR